MNPSVAAKKQKNNPGLLLCKIPISNLVSHKLPLAVIKSLYREHQINVLSRSSKETWISASKNHHCDLCDTQITVFSPKTNKHHLSHNKIKANIRRQTDEFKIIRKRENQKAYSKSKSFPPSPPSKKLMETIATDFCNMMSFDIFSETGCTICGTLTKNSDLVFLNE